MIQVGSCLCSFAISSSNFRTVFQLRIVMSLVSGTRSKFRELTFGRPSNQLLEVQNATTFEHFIDTFPKLDVGQQFSSDERCFQKCDIIPVFLRIDAKSRRSVLHYTLKLLF
jgi:hypothetical protein